MTLNNPLRKSAFINAIEAGKIQKLKNIMSAPDFQLFLKEGMGPNDPLFHALLKNNKEAYRLLVSHVNPPFYSTLSTLFAKGEEWKEEIELTLNTWNIASSGNYSASEVVYRPSLYATALDLWTFHRLLQARLPFETENKTLQDRVLTTFISRPNPDFQMIKEAIELGFKTPRLSSSLRIDAGLGRFRTRPHAFKKGILDLLIQHDATDYIDLHLFSRASDLKELIQILNWAEQKSPRSPEEHYYTHHSLNENAFMNPLESLLLSLNESHASWPPAQEWMHDLDHLLKRFEDQGYILYQEVSIGVKQNFQNWYQSTLKKGLKTTVADWMEANLPHVKSVLQKITLEKSLPSPKSSHALKSRI